MRLGTGELLIILVVVLLVFGPNKLPQFGDALGRGIRNFKKATNGLDEPEPEARTPAALSVATPAAQAPVETSAESTAAHA